MLTMFNHVSIDGYFCDARGDMSWAHASPDDQEWNTFVQGNAGGAGTLLFGRVTYQMMASFWPTPAAAQMMPAVAAAMNTRPKIVFSKTLTTASWQNTTLYNDGLVDRVRALKANADIAVMGSGTLVKQLAENDLIDTYQFVINPRALGGGRTLFDGVAKKLTHASTRTFQNGKVLLTYQR